MRTRRRRRPGTHRSRDRGRYGETAACFADVPTVEISWSTGSGADFVRWTRAMAGRGDRGDRAVHRLGPAAIRIDGGRALAELPLTTDHRVAHRHRRCASTSTVRTRTWPPPAAAPREGHPPRPGAARHPARRRPGRAGRPPAVPPTPGLVPAPPGPQRRRSPPR
ncbi:nuclear transport factor 2 family protein [Streptomyces sp. S465]|uniref:nuclear transport factor 2 family protein n=1 Tax=Streptomyces sp. S465 TaxID=2979468 RepID=UPI003FCDA01D